MERASLAFSNPYKFKLFQSLSFAIKQITLPAHSCAFKRRADVLQPASTSLKNKPKNEGNV